jgi:hypothetical protein
METFEKVELQSAEVDATLAEMETFNGLVEQIDSIPAELKETLQTEAFGMKLGGSADNANGYAKA